MSRAPGAKRKTAAWKGESSEMGGVSGATVTPSSRSPPGTKATSDAKLNRSTTTSLVDEPEAEASQEPVERGIRRVGERSRMTPGPTVQDETANNSDDPPADGI
jgi:hypothetical protein